MDSTALFTVALGLQSPWEVDDIRFEPEQGEIHFDLVCRAKRLACPCCGQAEQPIHDRLERTWQHLHFFQYKAYLHTNVPRVRCDGCQKTTQVAVPWARLGSGFTLLMDALVLALAKKLPIAEIAKLFGVSAGRIWQALNVHVEAARAQESHAEVTRIGVDEKHVGRSIGFISLFHDATGRRVLFGTAGRDAQTFESFNTDFLAHGGKVEAVSAVSLGPVESVPGRGDPGLPRGRAVLRCFSCLQARTRSPGGGTARRGEGRARPQGDSLGHLESAGGLDVQTDQRHALATTLRTEDRQGVAHERALQGNPSTRQCR